MAFTTALANAVPTLWAASLLENREKQLVAVKLCNRDYEGIISEVGDKVKISGVVRPTISTYDNVTGLSDPETLPTTSTMLEITESDSFNFMVGDIDKKLAQGDFFDKQLGEAANGFAQHEDTFVYNQITKDVSPGITVDSLSAKTTFSTILSGLKTLWSNNVPTTERISIEASPSFIEKILLAKILNDTDNTGVSVNGFVSSLRTFNADLYLSNNIKKDSNNYEYIIMRTGQAVSFASKLTEVEPYRHNKYMADAVRAVNVYGAKVVRPKEIVVLCIKDYATETTV